MIAKMLITIGCAIGLATVLLAVPVPAQPPAPTPIDDPNVPRGVDVQARGPVHEAFANPTGESNDTPFVQKRPPAPIEEMPPAEKPEGNVAWIGGYWHFDEDRKDYLWVSGCWRTLPPGRQWVAGYWREQDNQGGAWQWVPGFWAAAEKQAEKAAELTYYPAPPAPPQVAPPGPPPDVNSFYMPGQWAWRDGRYVWVAGYYARVQPDYMWVPGHYRWTPYGYVYVAGYWDYNLPRRGMLYSPVVVDVRFVGPGFVYSPYYAVPDVMVVDALWVRPAYYHYYFGDYYGPRYGGIGFECAFVYSQRHYDAIVVYGGWEHRDNPRWRDAQLEIFVGRGAGRAPLPPRTLAEQRIIIARGGPGVNAHVMLAPGPKVAADRGFRTVALSREARVQEKVHAEEVHKAVAAHRLATESGKAGAPTAPRTTSLPHNTGKTVTPAATTHPTTAPAAKGPSGPGASAPGAHNEKGAAANRNEKQAQHGSQQNQQHAPQQKAQQQQQNQKQHQQNQKQEEKQQPPNQQRPPTGSGGGQVPPS